MKTKSTAQYLHQIDIFLSKENNILFSGFIFSLLNYFLYFRYPRDFFSTYLFDIPVSVLLGFITVWFYPSSRKYGVVDSMVFLCFLPLYVLAALSSVNSPPKTKPGKVKRDYTGLVDSFSDSLLDKIMEVYEGRIIERLVLDDSVCVTVEVPYGIKIPGQEYIHQLAPELHISEKHIIHSGLTSRKTQFIITTAGLREYDAFKDSGKPMNTFPEILDRILLKTPVAAITQIQPAESR